MTEPEIGQQLVQVVGPALAQGSATRSDLLAAAVSARAPSTVIQALLELPEGRFHDIDDVVPHLPE
jgi:hypothetical protein